MAGSRRKRSIGPRFGIGEWFGRPFVDLTIEDREALLPETKKKKSKRLACPFKNTGDPSKNYCNKDSGVCTMQLYARGEDGIVESVPGNHGVLRCLCPNRFLEDDLVRRWVGEVLLDTSSPEAVSEVPFLQGEAESEFFAGAGAADEQDDRASVGRIDSVLVHPDHEPFRWCAVEMQAVYFSGESLSKDYASFVDPEVTGIPFPTKTRRPDYRSSGPKRLMPQLQIKVPTLRRWGKKMAVVIDEAFFASLGHMDTVEDVSNADIAWFIVGFDRVGDRFTLAKREVIFTTLERAVEGLTAGTPVTLNQFESEILTKLGRQRTLL